MVKFVLKNNFFEFNSKIKQQISGTAIDTPYASIFMDKVKNFLTTKTCQKCHFGKGKK